MTAIVYRKLPAVPHRQYVRRIVNSRHAIWHRDPAIALRMSDNGAAQIAHVMRARSVGSKGQAPTEPIGEYGTEEVLP